MGSGKGVCGCESEAGTLRALLLNWVVVSLLAGTASAKPMNLSDPQPRWVFVEFEVSPADRPDQLDTVYTQKVLGWLEPGDRPGEVWVSIGRGSVEAHLMAGENPKPGSFDDFVWVFDADTGDVILAATSGTLIKTVDFGLFRSEVETEIRVVMATRQIAGFREPRQVLGQVIFGFCDEPDPPRCTPVAPVRYDPARGYVNAVGNLAVDFRGVTVHTFSPLGEAVFSELGSEPQPPRPRGSTLARQR